MVDGELYECGARTEEDDAVLILLAEDHETIIERVSVDEVCELDLREVLCADEDERSRQGPSRNLPRSDFDVHVLDLQMRWS